VGAGAQGWLRDFDADGNVTAREWPDPRADLAGVHVLVLSQHDLPRAGERAREFLGCVPIVALTRGWEGVTLHTRDGAQDIPGLPREESDPTGAGDVFAAALLVGYHETGDVAEAAAFAACAASCAVEGVGTSSLGDRAEVERRLVLRQRLIDEGEWDE
jgi:1D-myo-inositol 3-kinase